MTLRLPNSNVESILGAWRRATSHSGWGRERLLSRCQTDRRVMVPPCLPKQITSSNGLEGNVSSRTAICRRAWWSHCLCVKGSRSSDISRAITVESPVLCVRFDLFVMTFLQFTFHVETWLIGKNMAKGILPHTTSLSACLPGWKPQSCLRGGETCKCADGSRTRKRPAISSKRYSVSAELLWLKHDFIITQFAHWT